MTCTLCNGVGRIKSVPHAGIQTIETCSCLTDMQRRRRLEAQLKILDKKIEDFENNRINKVNIAIV
jgi:hypothetical protein